MKPIVLQFPDSYSIGTVSKRKLNSFEQWNEFSSAQGTVEIPIGMEIALDIKNQVNFDPSIFSGFEPESLTRFDWVCNTIASDEAIKHLQHLTGLIGLGLWETNIGNEALSSIKGLSNLKWLDIGDTKITDDGLVYLNLLSSLNELTLLNNEITDKGLVYLLKLANLEGLDLMNTLVSDKGVDELRKLTSLKNLRIFGTQITKKGYKEIKDALPKCRIRFYHPH